MLCIHTDLSSLYKYYVLCLCLCNASALERHIKFFSYQSPFTFRTNFEKRKLKRSVFAMHLPHQQYPESIAGAILKVDSEITLTFNPTQIQRNIQVTTGGECVE